MPTQFRKKPITISAEEWKGDNEAVLIEGVKGEFYPIDESVLAETYDRLSAADSDEAA